MMPETPPTPEELARWFLSTELGERSSHEELTLAAVRTYERLRAYLAVFLGSHGFDAVWARAVHIVRRTFPGDDTRHTMPPATPQQLLQAMVHGREPFEAFTVFLSLFTHFFTLLFSFIGADLGFHLLYQQWPALTALMTDKHTEETPQ